MVKITVKDYIDEKGISLKYIHEKTGIRYATLIDIVHNRRNSVNLKYLSKIMQAINISDLSLIMTYEK